MWSHPGSAPSSGARYVVRPGDSLWSIAVRLAKGGDPRVVAYAIAEHNRLDGFAVIRPGQVLWVPGR
ncbi:MAG: LysM peptidoglycan-binding domain-containing protein [Alicyclobacillus sp.]|nr:LysM peptidoglycan-binding domain-containing protein [Alicyclobacillus sp.]